MNISPDAPILRVLFHAGAEAGGHFQRQKICVLLHVAYDGHVPLKGRCMPEGEDGVCVAEVFYNYRFEYSIIKRLFHLIQFEVIIIVVFRLWCHSLGFILYHRRL